MKKLGVALALVVGIAVAAIAIVVGTGIYNVAADEEHTALGYWLLQTTRDRSIAARAADIEVPDLADLERVKRGAGNYDSMCVGCHLAPGAQETELSRGLYPEPPNLSSADNFNPARAFWVIKHGIKSTGMPAWGKSMEDSYIWDMVAFLREMPSMSAEQYATAVRGSEGHSHGGGESSGEHEQAEDAQESSSREEHSHDDSKSAPHEH
jgi:mono/diheme cytochrome c family protein